jgi:hypothetical protein
MNAPTKINPADYAPLGIQDIAALVHEGNLSRASAFDIVDSRVTNRILRKKPPVAKVVAYRNKLAVEMGLPEIAAPAAPTRAKQADLPADIAATNVEDLADQIVAQGFDIGEVLAALSRRISKS